MMTATTTQQVMPAASEFLSTPRRMPIDGEWREASSGA